MPSSAADHSVSLSSSGYADGLGRRVLEVDRETGEMIERLVVRPELTAFEQVLRARVARGAMFKDDRFARPREVSWDDEGHLTVRSSYVNGRRLCDVMDLACFAGVIGGIDAAIGLLLELLPALSYLHSEAKFAHGLLGTGRLTVTPSGSLVILDWVYGGTVEHLQLTRQRLWDELGIAAHPTPGPARLDLASDLTQSAMIAAALVVGRPLGDKDYPNGIAALRSEIVEVAQIRGNQEFSRGIERYFERALPLRPRRVFASADEALFELRMLLKNSIGIEPCRAAFREFLREADAVDPEGTEQIAKLEGPSHEHRSDDVSRPGEPAKPAPAAVKSSAKNERRDPAPIRVERFELERIAVEQVEQERRAREDAERVAREQADAERAERERIERERAVRELEDLERMAREKAEADRVARERAEAERREREKAEAERLERERAEAERLAREKAEAERVALERAEAERVAREKADAERIAREKADAERAAWEKAEAERLEREKLEAERLARERAEAERLSREREIAERVARDKADAERLEREEAEARRIAEEIAEAERLARDKAEAERLAREKAEAERVAREQAEAERLAKEQAEAERVVREKAEAERAAREKEEAERLARERAESERLAKEQAEAAAASKAEAQTFDGRRRRKKDRSARPRKDRLRSSRTPAPEAGDQDQKRSGWLVRPDHAAAFDPPVAQAPKPVIVPKASDTGRAVAVAPGMPLEPTIRQSGPQPIIPPAAPAVEAPREAPVQPPTIQLKQTAPAAPAGRQPDVRPTFQTIKLKAPEERPHGTIKRASARPATGPNPLPPAPDYPPAYESLGGARRIPWRSLAAAVVILAGGGYAAISMWPGSTAKPAAPAAAEAPPPDVAPAATMNGRVEIVTEPAGARILFDGKPAGVSPAAVPSVTPGRHVVTVLAEAGTVKRTIKVEAGATARVDIPIFSGFAAISAPIVVEVAEGGRNLGTSENHIMLTPGRHELRLTNKDLKYTTTETVEVEPGEVKEIKLDPKGAANINAQPWAEVWIDGTKVGDTPIANLELPLGSREIVFRHPQFGERKVMATITAGPAATISVDLSK